MFKNFNQVYNLILEDIIQSVTPEELEDRQKEYSKIRIKTAFDFLVKDNRMIKNGDGSYDVNSVLDLSALNLTSLEDLPYKLNKVHNDFYCSTNNLTSLKGCPKEVNGNFICSNNNLTNLIGAPMTINGDFVCSVNNLTSLEGCPKIVNGNFWSTLMKNGHTFTRQDISAACKVRKLINGY